MEAMKSCDPEKITSKSNRTRACHLMAIELHFGSPWVVTYCCTPMLNYTVYQHFVVSGNKMGPLPCLAAKECKTTQNRKKQPFLNSFTIHVMTFMNSQYHSYRTKDQNKSHETY